MTAGYSSRPKLIEGPTATPDWFDHGACVGVDPDIFFPHRGQDSNQAKAICAGCEVREVCLTYAVENGEKWGVWGGKSERQRRDLRAARNRERRRAS